MNLNWLTSSVIMISIFFASVVKASSKDKSPVLSLRIGTLSLTEEVISKLIDSQSNLLISSSKVHLSHSAIIQNQVIDSFRNSVEHSLRIIIAKQKLVEKSKKS